MMGLMFLLIAVLYFVVLFFATRMAYRLPKRYGAGKGLAGVSALMVFLLITVPVFWDWLPTRMVYKNYCSTQAGVTQYKTLEQWKAENPGVYETLRPYTDKNRIERDDRESTLYIIRDGKKIWGSAKNQRFSTYTWVSELPLNIRKFQIELIDDKTNKIILKYAEFAAGPGPGNQGYKIWLSEPYCYVDRDKYYSLMNEFKRR